MQRDQESDEDEKREREPHLGVVFVHHLALERGAIGNERRVQVDESESLRDTGEHSWSAEG